MKLSMLNFAKVIAPKNVFVVKLVHGSLWPLSIGCNDLFITDHRPLVKVMGDRTLDEIPNSRLFRLKQCTWVFKIAQLAKQIYCYRHHIPAPGE